MNGGSDVAAKRVDLAYNNLGQVTGYIRYADLAGTALVATSAYTYDAQGRLTNLVHEQGTTQFADYEWTWDTLDRITAFTNSVWTAEDAVFDYDRTSQLISAERANNNNEAYSYDANGNRTMSGYTTGPNNQLLSDGTYDYEYDAEGNRTKKTAANGHYVTYTWDHRNRLVEVKFFDDTHTLQKSVAYGYDALNRRVWKEVNTDGDTDIDRVERYVYDAAGKRDGVTDVPLDDVALVFNETGSLTTRALHGPAIDQLFASEDILSDETFWSLTNHQGTVRDIATYNAGTNETKVINHITYTTFGQITAEVDPSNNNAAPTQASLLEGDFRTAYTGREYAADAELYYYRERWYDAAVGRFVSEDPIGFIAGDANLTRLASNRIVSSNDPSGRTPPGSQVTVDPPAIVNLKLKFDSWLEEERRHLATWYDTAKRELFTKYGRPPSVLSFRSQEILRCIEPNYYESLFIEVPVAPNGYSLEAGPLLERYHPDARWGLRSKPARNGAALQFTYDSSGKLLRTGVSVGTADRVAGGGVGAVIDFLIGTGGHYSTDVVPYHWAEELDKYYGGESFRQRYITVRPTALD